MSQENQAAEQQQTPEQTVAQIEKFRDAIIAAAIDNKLSFDVVFNALSQTVATFMFDFLLLSKGELSDAAVDEAVAKFNSQTVKIAKLGLENMREHAKQQAVEDATPKIITEV